jgi:hypothetical protein
MSTRKITNFIDKDQVKKDLAYSLADLSTAMMQQASLYVHYGVLASQAAKQVDDFELLLDLGKSKIYRKLRDSYAAAGEKVAVATLDKEVDCDPVVISLRLALNEAKQVEAVARTAVDAFRQRKDMLIQHGSTEREEMRGELSLRAKSVAQEGVQAMGSRVAARLAGASS